MSQTFSQHEHTHHAPGVASSQNMQSWPNIIMVGIWTLTHAIKHTCSKLDGSEKQLSTKLICNCHMCTTHVGYTSQSHIETHDKLHRTHTRTHKHRPARGCLEEDRGSLERGTRVEGTSKNTLNRIMQFKQHTRSWVATLAIAITIPYLTLFVGWGRDHLSLGLMLFQGTVT